MALVFSWKYDPERCISCSACTAACKSENNTNPTTSEKSSGPAWRWVVKKSSGKYAALNSTYREDYLSMACFHCKSPACIKACPTTPNAITKNTDTGLVTIDNTKCVGCKRCMWVCPYGAPRFNENTGKVEKCTGCSHKLYQKTDGSYDYTTPPACVSTCSGNALNYEWLSTALSSSETGSVPDGFARPKLTSPQVQFVK